MGIFVASKRLSGSGQLISYSRTGVAGANILANPYRTDLVGWWRSTDVEKDGSNFVSSVTDMTGLNHPLIEETGIYQPLWVDDQLNGAPIIRFGHDGVNPSRLAASFVQAAPYTVYLVMRNVERNDGVYMLDFGGTSSLWENGAYSAPEINFTDRVSAETRNTDLAINTWGVVTLQCTGAGGAGSLCQVNDNSPTTASRANSGDMTTVWLGGLPSVKKLDLAEILIYGTTHNATQIGNMDHYLRSKYNISA